MTQTAPICIECPISFRDAFFGVPKAVTHEGVQFTVYAPQSVLNAPEQTRLFHNGLDGRTYAFHVTLEDPQFIGVAVTVENYNLHMHIMQQDNSRQAVEITLPSGRLITAGVEETSGATTKFVMTHPDCGLLNPATNRRGAFVFEIDVEVAQKGEDVVAEQQIRCSLQEYIDGFTTRLTHERLFLDRHETLEAEEEVPPSLVAMEIRKESWGDETVGQLAPDVIFKLDVALDTVFGRWAIDPVNQTLALKHTFRRSDLGDGADVLLPDGKTLSVTDTIYTTDRYNNWTFCVDLRFLDDTIEVVPDVDARLEEVTRLIDQYTAKIRELEAFQRDVRSQMEQWTAERASLTQALEACEEEARELEERDNELGRSIQQQHETMRAWEMGVPAGRSASSENDGSEEETDGGHTDDAEDRRDEAPEDPTFQLLPQNNDPNQKDNVLDIGFVEDSDDFPVEI